MARLKKPPLVEEDWTRCRMGRGASQDLQRDRNGEKVTLVGTLERIGTPLTLNIPLDKSKHFSEESWLRKLRVEMDGSLGGAMKENR